jgi:hypothetical protein
MWRMRTYSINGQRRLYLIAAAILLAGLGSAVLIYLTAGNAPGNPLGMDPEDSRKYLHDLELYGGKMNLLVSEFMQWFGGLWQGRPLAFTVGGITLGISAGVMLFAHDLPAEAGGGKRQDG